MNVPSPRRGEPRLNGTDRAPWNTALLEAVRKLEHRAETCERENAELRAAVAKQNQSLAEARRRLENWHLRQLTWRTERAELLEKIKTFS